LPQPKFYSLLLDQSVMESTEQHTYSLFAPRTYFSIGNLHPTSCLYLTNNCRMMSALLQPLATYQRESIKALNLPRLQSKLSTALQRSLLAFLAQTNLRSKAGSASRLSAAVIRLVGLPVPHSIASLPACITSHHCKTSLYYSETWLLCLRLT
jgi:hypothetical protein